MATAGSRERCLAVLDLSTGERLAFGQTGGGLVDGSIALGDDIAIVNTAQGETVLFESCTTTLAGRCVVS